MSGGVCPLRSLPCTITSDVIFTTAYMHCLVKIHFKNSGNSYLKKIHFRREKPVTDLINLTPETDVSSNS